MQRSLATQPPPRPSQPPDMYGKLSAGRVIVAIALLLITLAIACGRNVSGDEAARNAFSPHEFSPGMPLP